MGRIALVLAFVALFVHRTEALAMELGEPSFWFDVQNDEIALCRWQEGPQGNNGARNGNGQRNGNGGRNGNGQNGEEPSHISDNSFLIEEAYNQEPGVVQHIFNWFPTWRNGLGEQREFSFLYVMELPVGSQTHQFSFTPMVFEHFFERPDGGPAEEEGGVGDFLLNYRYQLATEDEQSWVPAIAPRFTVILPTGDEDRGLGTGEVGYQFNLPISKQLEPFAFHFNAGYTHVPGVSVILPGGDVSPGRDLRSYNLGASVVWLANYDLNFLLEFVAFWNEELDENGLRDRTNELLLNPGVRYAVYTSEEVQWVVGVGVPIGLSSDAPDIGVFGYLSVEHAFRKRENGSQCGGCR